MEIVNGQAGYGIALFMKNYHDKRIIHSIKSQPFVHHWLQQCYAEGLQRAAFSRERVELLAPWPFACSRLFES